MLSQYYLLVYLISFTLTIITADIVSGKCPKVSGTKFDCLEILKVFKHSDKRVFGENIQLLIYGLLLSSPVSKSLNIFAFDFENATISDYFGALYCEIDGELKFDYIVFRCGLLLGKDWHR